MKEKFRSDKVSSKRLEYISVINSILEEYSKQGYRLTLRQLYYQLVARDKIPNRVQEYSKLSSVLVAARMNGLTDWSMIEDRTRRPHIPYWVRSIKEALVDTIRQYRLDRQKEQEKCVEIWSEKDAVSNILKRVSEYFHIRLMINRGYSSCSAMKMALDRLQLPGRKTIILYVGDHDPSGLDMIRDIETRLDEFGLDSFKVIHVALTKEQIDEYNPPPNPAKITDPRARKYIYEHGSESWELDALKPNVLEEIVRKNVENYIDLDLFELMIKREKEDKEKLRKIIENI